MSDVKGRVIGELTNFNPRKKMKGIPRIYDLGIRDRVFVPGRKTGSFTCRVVRGKDENNG